MVLAVGALAGCGGGSHAATGDGTAAAVVTVTVTAPPTPSSDSTLPSAPPNSADPDSGPASVPTTAADAMAQIAAGHPVPGETVSFVSPTGGIYCALAVGETGPACELTRARLAPEPGSHLGCSMVPTIGRIELSASKATPVCNTDTIVTPGAPTLAYGDVAVTRDTECVIERIGVTCVGRNGQGAGFFLSAERYVLLG
jgi:hypothetical protein